MKGERQRERGCEIAEILRGDEDSANGKAACKTGAIISNPIGQWPSKFFCRKGCATFLTLGTGDVLGHIACDSRTIVGWPYIDTCGSVPSQHLVGCPTMI